MSIFDEYNREFMTISQDITKNVNELRDLTPGDSAVKDISAKIESLMTQNKSLIKQMEVEARSHDPATRKALTEKVNTYRKSLTTLSSDFEKAKEKAERSALIGEASAADRQRLLNVNDTISNQNETIRRALQTVEETEEVGQEIIKELGRNREKIHGAQSKVNDFAGLNDSARRLIAAMSRRDIQQRMILAGVAFLLMIAVGVVIYCTSGNKAQN